MNRKSTVVVALCTVVSIGLSFVSTAASGQDFMPERFDPSQFVEYERQLNAILKTRRDEEKLFVGKVVEQVRLGKLPSKLVSTSYQWVHKKRPDTNYPFLYFEKVLRLQAEALRIEDNVPPFDFSIYKSAGRQTEGQNGSAGRKTEVRKNSFFRAGNRRGFKD